MRLANLPETNAWQKIMITKKTSSPLLLFFVAGLLSLSLIFVPAIQAQEASSTSPLKTELIWEKARLDEEIAQTRLVYNQNLEKYRSEERLRNIALDQYTALKTLASLDDLVIKTKTLAMTRNQTLINYFTLLKLNLLSSEGVELSLQSQYLATLDQGINFLEDHTNDLQTKNSLEEIQASLIAFQELGDPQSFSQKVLAILALARLQRIYDLALPLKADIVQSFESGSISIDPIALERAETETSKTLQTTQESLQTLWAKANNPSDLSTIYRNLSRDLEPVYVNLAQSLAYFKELLSF